MGTENSRKLVAIMFTDIVGYSRMMSVDEDHALRLLDVHDALITAIISDHGGNVLKRMGDAVFAEFESAIAAVKCGIQVQQRLGEHNSAAEGNDQLSIRIGIHLGDVVVRGQDLFGEGINVAARLEPLAKPGGICISDAVYQAVKRQSGIEPIRVGEVELKNIVERQVIYQFPPFYETEDVSGKEKRGDDVRAAQSAIGLVRTDVLPAASGIPHLLGLVFLAFISVLMGACLPQSSGDGWRLTQREFHNAREVTLALMNARSGVEWEIWRAFAGDSRRELAELVASPGASLNEPRLTSTLRKQLNHVITGARSLDPPREGREGEFAEQNRRTIESLFPDQITSQVSERSGLDLLLANLDFWGADGWAQATLGFVFIGFVGVPLLIYLAIRPATHRYVFSDIRNVDEIVEYLIRDMGFNAPTRESKMLRFRATLKTVLIWSVLQITARVDGNSVIVSGPAHFIRRLRKSVVALSGLSPAAA